MALVSNHLFVNKISRELNYFKEDAYEWMIASVDICPDSLNIKGVLKDGRTFEVDYKRKEYPFWAPKVKINNFDIMLCSDDWSPALTGVKWLMMLAFMTPEES